MPSMAEGKGKMLAAASARSESKLSIPRLPSAMLPPDPNWFALVTERAKVVKRVKELEEEDAAERLAIAEQRMENLKEFLDTDIGSEKARENKDPASRFCSRSIDPCWGEFQMHARISHVGDISHLVDIDPSGPVVNPHELGAMSCDDRLEVSKALATYRAHLSRIVSQLDFAHHRLDVLNKRLVGLAVSSNAKCQGMIAPLIQEIEDLHTKLDKEKATQATLVKYNMLCRKLEDLKCCVEQGIARKHWDDALTSLQEMSTRLKTVPTLPDTSPLLPEDLKQKLQNSRQVLEQCWPLFEPKKKEKDHVKSSQTVKALSVLEHVIERLGDFAHTKLSAEVQPEVVRLLAEINVKEKRLKAIYAKLAEQLMEQYATTPI